MFALPIFILRLFFFFLYGLLATQLPGTTAFCTVAFTALSTRQYHHHHHHCTTTTTAAATTTTHLHAVANTLKPAAEPLMNAGKALARTGELLIDVTTALDLYGGALSAVGAEVRNAGDAIAQAAASMRFKTGMELVIDELRESGTCLQEASQKCQLAVREAQQDKLVDLMQTIGQMQEPFLTAGQALEGAGAAILQRAALARIGQYLVEAATALQTLSQLLPALDDTASSAAVLAGQRLEFCVVQMTLAGNELQGIVPTTQGESWLKGSGDGVF